MTVIATILANIEVLMSVNALEGLRRSHNSAIIQAKEKFAADGTLVAEYTKRIADSKIDSASIVDTYSDEKKFSLTVGKAVIKDKKTAGIALMAKAQARLNQHRTKKPIQLSSVDYSKVALNRTQKYADLSDEEIPEFDYIKLGEYGKLNEGYVYAFRNIDSDNFSPLAKWAIKPRQIKKSENERTIYEETNSQTDRKGIRGRLYSGNDLSVRNGGTGTGNAELVSRSAESYGGRNIDDDSSYSRRDITDDQNQERREEAAAVKKYRTRIKLDVDTLTKWILHPSNKDVLKHVPDALKSSVIPFLRKYLPGVAFFLIYDIIVLDSSKPSCL